MIECVYDHLQLWYTRLYFLYIFKVPFRLCCFPDEDVLNSVHQFRPNFLGSSKGLPCYYDPDEFNHNCLLMSCHQKVDSDGIDLIDENSRKKCSAIPFVLSNNFKKIDVAKEFAAIIKEVLIL